MHPTSCKHLLTNSTYNDRDDLSEELDKESILDLMENRCSPTEYEKIWRSCHGGLNPPMNMLFHLHGLNCTLGDFKGYVECEDKSRVKDLETLLAAHGHCTGKRICDSGFPLLTRIAELTAVKRHPEKRALWKRLASRAGLKEEDIKALDSPVTGVRESYTMAFITRTCQTTPATTAAWLAEGLYAIGRNDILLDRKFQIFEKCRIERCIEGQFLN